MWAQQGLTPWVVSTSFLIPLLESGLGALPLIFLFGLTGPQGPSRKRHPLCTRDQQGAQAGGHHPPGVCTNGREEARGGGHQTMHGQAGSGHCEYTPVAMGVWD